MHFFFKENLLPGKAETTANTNLTQRTKLFFLHICTNQHLFCCRGSINSGKSNKISSLVIWAAFSRRSGALVAQACELDGAEGNEGQGRLRWNCSPAHTPTPACLRYRAFPRAQICDSL